MTEREIVLRYAPVIHFDHNETIPLRAVAFTIFRENDSPSQSFPGRVVPVLSGGMTIEYAYYWDYDIQHGYDLEHIWVYLDAQGSVCSAEGSFHGKYLNLWIPELPACLPLLDGHVQAYCQPGKHAFLVDGAYFRLVSEWRESCMEKAGGPVLVGNPFSARWSPTHRDEYTVTEEDNELCERYLRKHLAFEPTLDFTVGMPEDLPYMPWKEMYERIPEWVMEECARLRQMDL